MVNVSMSHDSIDSIIVFSCQNLRKELAPVNCTTPYPFRESAGVAGQ